MPKIAILPIPIDKEKNAWFIAAITVPPVILAVRSATLPGAKEGLSFYLIPDFSKISGATVIAAMNQAFFSLSIGIGSMAIFGSYIGKDRSLLGESVNVVCLDTFVAVVAGLIIFPACFTYNLEVGAGPGLLFDTMASVFLNMSGGRFWGALFFLFMVFAGMSTVFAVFENILACVRELFGWSRPKGCIVCGVVMFAVSLTTALGYSVWAGFVPFAEGTAWLDLWDFIVSTNLLPLGAIIIALFCCSDRFGWGWDNFVAEANTGKGFKIQPWMKPLFKYVVPVVVIGLYIYGLFNFPWK
ncbi:MAG: sodium-dependent transporter [Firmicutes bacterium]|nr:sodium-dependent transporter [Bacillota bacterium]